MRLFILSLFSLVLLGSCNIIDMQRVEGNGKVSTKIYDFKNFDKVDASGAVTLYVKQDSAYNVKLETDENLFQYLKITEANGTLRIDTKDGYRLDPSDKLKIHISLPEINHIELSGASQIHITDKFVQNENIGIDMSGACSGDIKLRAPKVKADISGATTLNIEGETRETDLQASGASTINAFDLKAEKAVVSASGASNARVFASVSLNGDASGASGIRYKGNPAKVVSDASGASSIKKEE